jgi:hypothetical protein
MGFWGTIFHAIRPAFLRAVIIMLMAMVMAVGCSGGGGGGPENWTDQDDPNCTDLDADGYYVEKGCGKSGDCKDRDPTIHPGATEYCDAVDNDCDGQIDEGCAPEICGDGQDNDGDGVADEACRQGSSYIVDTGLTRCYSTRELIYPCPSPGEAFSGQDACYASISSSFTKLDVNGLALPAEAPAWSMVRDEFTGLIWEVKTDDEGIHDKDLISAWADAADVLIAQLNMDNYGGFSDWRLPTIMELTRITDFGTYGPAISQAYFPNTVSDFYWSSTPGAADPDSAWILDFKDGSAFPERMRDRCYVRAVRGQSPALTFMDNADGTVTAAVGDRRLMWAKASSLESMYWQNALEYCEGLELAGYSDWRLPNIKELRSIVDYERHNPAIDLNYFPDTESLGYWTSTTCVINFSNAWIVGFASGGGEGGNDKNYDYQKGYARAVRGGL